MTRYELTRDRLLGAPRPHFAARELGSAIEFGVPANAAFRPIRDREHFAQLLTEDRGFSLNVRGGDNG